MVVGLHLRVSNGQTSFERSFMRPPVIIGRDKNAARCVIQNLQVSKVHACIDIEDGTIRVRDVGSTNGTYVGGRRLTPNCWVRPGAAGEPVKLRIGEFKIVASIYQENTLASNSLAELADEVPGSDSLKKAGARLRGTSAAPFVPKQRPAPAPLLAASGTFEMHGPVVRLGPKYLNALSGMSAFYDALAEELNSAPPPARPHICKEFVNAYASLADDPCARAVLERHGWSGSSSDQPGEASLGRAALAAMRELSCRYVGSEPTTPAEVASFKESLRATLDEFLLGYTALVAGMNRFEEQVAVQSQHGVALPSSPAQLAAGLLDWVGDGENLRERLRASFAELMMHQIALLNGLMSGVKALLTELSPARIEKAAAGHRHGLFSSADPWTEYKRRHSDLADEENERFRLLFGPEFVEEYRQFAREGTIPEMPEQPSKPR